MPSEKVLLEKQKIVSEIADKLSKAVCGVIVDYKGISVEQDTKLRAELRASNIEYFVIKNRLLKLALEKIGLSGLDYVLEGTTSVAVSYEDPVAPAKIIDKYSKELDSIFNIKAGFIDNKAADKESIEALAKLPSKEMLIAMTLAGLNAPIAGLANVLNANIRGLAIALNAIAEQKGA
ncbi:MAG: 50S ribosomal protein L10 [Oscillospiraceae bacterium]|nr:50S ribosomal protein L10 [Oscillospiraceae bacterium]